MTTTGDGALVPAKSGEIVDAAPIGAVHVAGNIFAPIILKGKAGAKPSISRISQRELKFVNKLLATGNLNLACHEVGSTLPAGKRLLKSARIKQFIDEMIEQTALANATTVNDNLVWLRNVREGDTPANQRQMDAAKVIARILQPRGAGSVHVNVNQQFNGGANQAANPYSGMPFDQVISETEERILALKGHRPGSA